MTTGYKDDDLVYVDPEKKAVVSLVEFDKDGNAKQLEMKFTEKANNGKEGEKPVKKRGGRKRYYPWGTYKTMKKIYRIEGKEKEAENYKTLDKALSLALEEPYWD